VSKYYARGNLVKYLKGLSDFEYAKVDSLKMIHEISKGMAYLHKQGVLHGDLKVQQLFWIINLIVLQLTLYQAANILVDDDTRCVISDFGQSEMKSEVYRISRTPVPRKSDRLSIIFLYIRPSSFSSQMGHYAGRHLSSCKALKH